MFLSFLLLNYKWPWLLLTGEFLVSESFFKTKQFCYFNIQRL